MLGAVVPHRPTPVVDVSERRAHASAPAPAHPLPPLPAVDVLYRASRIPFSIKLLHFCRPALSTTFDSQLMDDGLYVQSAKNTELVVGGHAKRLATRLLLSICRQKHANEVAKA